MICLPDVNLWIALASDQHIHHRSAKMWFDGIRADSIAFCRITELGLLRLVTNRHVMADDVLTPAEAWDVYDRFRADPRVLFLDETTGFSRHWRMLGAQIQGGSNAWTDTYLAAFASYSKQR